MQPKLKLVTTFINQGTFFKKQVFGLKQKNLTSSCHESLNTKFQVKQFSELICLKRVFLV